MVSLKNYKKRKQQEQAFMIYYNKGYSNHEIARLLEVSTRTVIRWKKRCKKSSIQGEQPLNCKRKRKRQFAPVIFARILALKKEMPKRTAVAIQRRLKTEFPTGFPSQSTIRKYLCSRGYSFKGGNGRQGYVKFQREQPNDLWQIDIAGHQSLSGLGKVYLIAILDDCSRFIVGARYFLSQTSSNILQVLKTALITYGRPNQIIADNGRQFKNVMGDLNTRYVNLLLSLDIQAVFSRPHRNL